MSLKVNFTGWQLCQYRKLYSVIARYSNYKVLQGCDNVLARYYKVVQGCTRLYKVVKGCDMSFSCGLPSE